MGIVHQLVHLLTILFLRLLSTSAARRRDRLSRAENGFSTSSLRGPSLTPSSLRPSSPGPQKVVPSLQTPPKVPNPQNKKTSSVLPSSNRQTVSTSRRYP